MLLETQENSNWNHLGDSNEFYDAAEMISMSRILLKQ